MSTKPQVLWSQKDKFLKLVIDVIDPKKDSLVVKLTENSLFFEVEGQKTGDSLGKFSFDLEFHKNVNPQRYKAEVKDRRIKLVIAKAEDSEHEWARISPTKERWLKFDVNSIDLTDEETIAARKLADAKTRLEAQHGPLPEEVQIKQMSEMMNVDDISRDLEEAEKEMYDMVRNSYLTIYNSVVGIGYLYVFAVSLIRLGIEGKDAIGSNYRSMGWLLKSCQHTVYLELLHTYFGLTKGHLASNLLQIFGRSIVLFGVLDMEPSLQTSLVTYILMVTWTGIEVIRYPYYIGQIYDAYLPKLMWLRYNAWIPLYPVGIICEGWLVYHCIRLTSDSGRLTLTLPNVLNVSFDFTSFLMLHLALLVVGGMMLMHYMWAQRARAMKKLDKLYAMEDVYYKERDLYNIRKKKEKGK